MNRRAIFERLRDQGVLGIFSQRALGRPDVVGLFGLLQEQIIEGRALGGGKGCKESPAGDVGPWLAGLEAEHYRQLLEVPGVGGAWMYGPARATTLHANVQHDPRYVTVVYLDEDPLAVAKSLTPLVEHRWASGAVRPLFAGPLRSMVRWDAWPD